jgi:cell division GTPase FtsZ
MKCSDNRVIVAINGSGTTFIEWLKVTKKEEVVALINRHEDILQKLPAKYKIFADKNISIEKDLLELKKELVEQNIFIVISLADDYSDVILNKFLHIFEDKLTRVCIIAVTPFDFEGKLRLQQSKDLKEQIDSQNVNIIEISYQLISEMVPKKILFFDFLKEVNKQIYNEIEQYKF